MSNFKRSLKNAEDKFEGKVKEATGQITGDQKMELKGKIQVAKADVKERANIVDKKAIKIKDDIAEKINDKIDKLKSK